MPYKVVLGVEIPLYKPYPLRLHTAIKVRDSWWCMGPHSLRPIFQNSPLERIITTCRYADPIPNHGAAAENWLQFWNIVLSFTVEKKSHTPLP